MDQLFKDLFDLARHGEEFDSNDGDWHHRLFFCGLAFQCPATLFDLLGQEALYISQKPYRFWDFTDIYNPVLILNPEDPLAILWVLSSMFFAYPWTGPAVVPLIVKEFEDRARQRQQSKAQSTPKPQPKQCPLPSPKTNPGATKSTDNRQSSGGPMLEDQATAESPKGVSFAPVPAANATITGPSGSQSAVDWLQTVKSARRRVRQSLNAQKRVLQDFFLPPS